MLKLLSMAFSWGFHTVKAITTLRRETPLQTMLIKHQSGWAKRRHQNSFSLYHVPSIFPGH